MASIGGQQEKKKCPGWYWCSGEGAPMGGGGEEGGNWCSVGGNRETGILYGENRALVPVVARPQGTHGPPLPKLFS